MSRKITIIGAGSVGSTIAYSLSQEELASQIVMIDINKDKAEGEVMDIEQEPVSVSLSRSSPVIIQMPRILTL